MRMHNPLKDAIERLERAEKKRKKERERFIGTIIATSAIAAVYARGKKRRASEGRI